MTSKIIVLVGYPSKNVIRFISPFPRYKPLIILALRANIPVFVSLVFGVWIIDESLVKKIFPISELTNLLAIVIGISKFLFNTDWISLSEEPVAFKIFFNVFVEYKSLSNAFN